MEQSQSYLQRFLRSELSFYIGLIGTIFAVAVFYFSSTAQMQQSTNDIKSQVALVAQRLDIYISSRANLPERISAVEKEVAVLTAKENKGI